MKTIWVAIILLFVVMAGSAALYIYTSILYGDLQEGLNRLQQQVEGEEWAKAREEAGQLKELWNRADSSWTPIMDHRQVDRVDEAFTRVFCLLELEQKEDLLLEIAVARRSLYRLKSTEAPNLRNVF